MPATRAAKGEFGVASQYLDVKNEDGDFFFKSYLDPAQLKAGYDAGSQDARDLLAGYVAGDNRYVVAHAGALPAACRNAAWVRPISVEDMQLVIAEKALHASGEIFVREVAAAGRSVGEPVALRGPDSLPDPTFVDRTLAAIGEGSSAAMDWRWARKSRTMAAVFCSAVRTIPGAAPTASTRSTSPSLESTTPWE